MWISRRSSPPSQQNEFGHEREESKHKQREIERCGERRRRMKRLSECKMEEKWGISHSFMKSIINRNKCAARHGGGFNKGEVLGSLCLRSPLMWSRSCGAINRTLEGRQIDGPQTDRQSEGVRGYLLQGWGNWTNIETKGRQVLKLTGQDYINDCL